MNITGRTDDQGVTVPFEQAAQLGVQAFQGVLEKSYGVPLTPQAHGKAVVNGLPALAWTFTQAMPARTGFSSSSTGEVLTHEVAAVDVGQNIALLWVQTPSSCPMGMCKGKAEKFINSFQIPH